MLWYWRLVSLSKPPDLVSDSEACLLGPVSVSDWPDSGFLIKTSGDRQIVTEKNPATALFNSIGDTQSDTLPP